MKLWFVTNGPQGAWEGPGAMSGSVAHASPLKKKLQNAKIFLDGPGLSYRRIARNGASLSCLRITGTGPGYPVGG